MSNTYNGVIPVNKPAGMTSHDVVSRLRRILKTKKVGHTGTLDPDVTGVLPMCIGKATKLSDYIMELPKTYVGQLVLGISTSTQDFTGDVVESIEVDKLKQDQIQSIFHEFKGEIEQMPPMYSSVKINGKKLYELARQGKEVQRKPRKVFIYELKIIDYRLDEDNPKVDFEVTCSKGTYIRTLCVDIGNALGYPAHMSKLTRVKSGAFYISETYTIEEIENYANQGQIENILVNMTDSLPHLKKMVLSNEIIHHKVFNGQQIQVNDEWLSYEGIFKVEDNTQKLVALYNKKQNSSVARPVKVFKED